MPRLSIITPVLNAAGTLPDCLGSIGRQSADFEHVIVDGGSTDASLEFVQGNGEHPVTLVSEPDRGLYDAINKGIGLAQGDVVGVLNADDFYASDRVLELVSKVFDAPDVDTCYGDLEYVDRDDTGKVTRRWKAGQCSESALYSGWMPPHPTFFVRRELYQKHGLYRLDLGTAADYELMLRLLLKYRVKAAYIPEVLVRMRTHGVSNVSVMNRLRANRNDRKAWKVNGLRPRPWTLVAKPLRKVGQWVLR